MTTYPEAVNAIANDYLDRVRRLLKPLPWHEQEEIVRELRSHVFEAYRAAVEANAGADPVALALGVLRGLGEPADVVADRLPSTHDVNLPRVVLGLAIAVFAVPLGFGGLVVALGLAIASLELLVVCFAIAGGLFAASAACAVAGFTMIYNPALWTRLFNMVASDMDPDFAAFVQNAPVDFQGALLLMTAAVLAAAGLGMIWLGKRVFRGVRFLGGVVFAKVRRELPRTAARFREWTSKPNGTGRKVSLA